MGGTETRRRSVGRRIAAGALSAILALCGATAATALADDAIVVGQKGVEEASVAAGAEGIALDAQSSTSLEVQTPTTTVTYQEASWDASAKKVTYAEKSASCVTLTSSDDQRWIDGKTYVVPSSGMTINGNAIVDGTVGLVLTDGATLTMRGISVAGGTLNVYGQTAGSGKLVVGPLVDGTSGGIALDGATGTIVVHGGTVEATGSKNAAGIGGGGDRVNGGVVTVYGGTVKATGDEAAAGIGGGSGGSGGTTTVYGGEIVATGGAGGAGIGGGSGGSGGTTTVYGGTVKATGGKTTDEVVAPGIGNGASSEIERQEESTVDSGTLAVGSGRFLYGSASDIGIGVDDAVLLLSGETSSYEGDRFQYMVVNGNKATVSLSYAKASVDKTWSDAAFTNELTNPSGMTVSYASSDEAVATVDSSGKVTIKGVGTTTITASFAGDDAHAAASASYELTVKKLAVSLSYATASVTKAVDDDAFTNPLTNPSGVTVSYASSDEGVATVDSAGKVTLKGAGTATITAAYAGDDTHAAASARYKLVVNRAKVTLKFKKDAVTKALGAKAFTNRLTNKSGLTVTYESSNEKVAKVNKATGKVTLRGLGTATITATFAGDATRGAASASYRVVVRLAKTKGLKTVCHPSARTVDVSWKAVKGARKYQVQWRLRGGKWRTRTTEGTELTLKGMRARRYYEIRVRAVSGKTRGAWSTVARRWYVPASGVSARSAAKGKVKVSWSKTKGANKGYLVLVRYSRDGKVVAQKRVGKGQTSATISGLKSGRRAWVSVRPLRKAYGRTWVGVLTPIAGVRVS